MVVSLESYVSVIADQVLVMLLLMAAGFFSYKVKIISNEGSKQITNILILLVSPVVIFVSYQRDFDPEMLKGLAQAFGIALLGFAIAMAGAYLLLRAKGKEGKAALAVERFSVIYSNCGFIGIPLVQALFGNEGVFYLTAVMTAFNILVWTHGLFLFTGGEKFSIKGLLKALCSPSILAVPIGLICFLLRLRVPDVVLDAMNYIAGMNTPLAMLVAGVTVAQTNLIKAFTRPRTYYVSFLKLILLPLLIVLAYSVFKLPAIISLTIAVAMAAPSGAMCTMFAVRYDRDAHYASEIFAATTILSMATLPLIVWVAGFLL